MKVIFTLKELSSKIVIIQHISAHAVSQSMKVFISLLTSPLKLAFGNVFFFSFSLVTCYTEQYIPTFMDAGEKYNVSSDAFNPGHIHYMFSCYINFSVLDL